jgi:hypothetical protein
MRERLVGWASIPIALVCATAQATGSPPKHSTLGGKVYRSDTGKPVSGAVVLLLDETKPNGRDGSVSATTDQEGRFSLTVEEGRYTLSIRTWYTRQEDAPCQLLMGRLDDKNSTVVVMKDGDRFVEQVFVKNFRLKANKPISRDFDLMCKSMFQ